MDARLSRYLFLTLGILLLVFNSLYVIRETERAVVLRFGRLIEANTAPGLHVKVPGIDEVRVFDARVLTLDSQPENFYTLEKKRLIVDSYAKWRIEDVETYYRATGGDESIARNRLAARTNDGLRNQFGKRRLNEVVSGQREQLMGDLTRELNDAVQASLGIRVIDVRVKKIDLPDEVRQSVYDRMSAEREKLAREYRSRGKEEGEKIRADADRQVTIIEAEAYRDAELIRGEGDAKASATYADAFSKDPEFYAFTRSLRGYEEAFGGGGDVLVLDPKSDFFRYLDRRSGNR